MHQFVINRFFKLDWFGYDASFTNSSLFMVAAVAVITAALVWAMRAQALVPSRTQSVAELSYEYIENMVRENLGDEGMKFFPWIFSLFMFILALNLMGMLPYSFTVTSHIIITFGLAAMVWLTVTVVGFMRHGVGFLKLFLPSGVPWWLIPIILPIELISYFIRPISHSVRLFANIMAGHTMLKVFAGFIVSFAAAGMGAAGIAPLAFMIAFTGLEVVIAFLQAFIFTVLTCIYLSDAMHMHH